MQTMPHDARSPTPASLHPSLLLAFAICGALVVGLFFIIGPGRPTAPVVTSGPHFDDPTQFAPLSIDEQRLARERHRHHGPVTLDRARPALERLYEAVYRAHRHQFPTVEGEVRASVVELEAALVFAADEVLPATGMPGFVVAGEPIFEACQEAIDELLLAIHRRSITLDQARTDPPLPRFARYRDNCGNALPMLLDHGLVTPDGRWARPYAPKLFEILNRLRWANILHARLPARLQITPYEYELLMRWRIEEPKAFPITKRRAFLREAATYLPHYDVVLAEALLDIEGQDTSFAVDRIRKIVEEHPEVPEYKLRLERLESRLRP